ncbi:hypothetical protein D3C85_1420280 [compost metagenome]
MILRRGQSIPFFCVIGQAICPAPEDFAQGVLRIPIASRRADRQIGLRLGELAQVVQCQTLGRGLCLQFGHLGGLHDQPVTQIEKCLERGFVGIHSNKCLC